MTFLFENIGFWLVAAFFCVFAGVASGRGTGKRAPIWGGIGIGVALAAVGVALVYFVPTDRKAVRKTIDELAAAVERNDLDGVLKNVSQDAPKTRFAAQANMALATIEKTKVRDFKIVEINRVMSPPRALVSFRGTVWGRGKVAVESVDFAVVVDFTSVELREEEPGVWRVSDRCEFSYPGGGSGSCPRNFDGF